MEGMRKEETSFCEGRRNMMWLFGIIFLIVLVVYDCSMPMEDEEENKCNNKENTPKKTQQQ